MRISAENIDKIMKLVVDTPESFTDICYYDGMPTTWDRGILNHRKNGEYIDYHCRECGTKRHYNLDKLREIREVQDE